MTAIEPYNKLEVVLDAAVASCTFEIKGQEVPAGELREIHQQRTEGIMGFYHPRPPTADDYPESRPNNASTSSTCHRRDDGRIRRRHGEP